MQVDVKAGILPVLSQVVYLLKESYVMIFHCDISVINQPLYSKL